MSALRDAKIYVAGHSGLAGSAIVRALRRAGHSNLLLRRHSELELTDARAVREFFERERPEYVFDAAAKVGGILANDTQPADFLRENLAIQANLIHESWRAGVKRWLFLGSSCIYPRDCPQPMKEEHLITGPGDAEKYVPGSEPVNRVLHPNLDGNANTPATRVRSSLWTRIGIWSRSFQACTRLSARAW